MKQHQEITAVQLPSIVRRYLQAHSGEVTLILPKGNPLISQIVKTFAENAPNGIQIIEGPIFGLSTEPRGTTARWFLGGVSVPFSSTASRIPGVMERTSLYTLFFNR